MHREKTTPTFLFGFKTVVGTFNFKTRIEVTVLFSDPGISTAKFREDKIWKSMKTIYRKYK